MTGDGSSAVLFKVFIVSKLVARLLEREVSSLPPDQIGLFSATAVWQPITPTELSRISGIKATTLSNAIRRFEDARLIVKTPNPSDGRSYLISLSPEGERVWEQTQPALARAIGLTETALGDDLDRVIEAMAHLEEKLRALVGQPSVPAPVRR